MKKSFSATEFLKRAMEFEEQQDQEPPKRTRSPQAKGKKSTAVRKQMLAAEEIPPKRDSLKIDRSFYKVPNVVDDLVAPNLSAAEEVIYRRLIRLSWGWGRNYCRAGIKYFQENSGIKSRTTIKSAIDSLIAKKIIYRCVDEDGRTDRNQNGTVYIVPIPSVSEIGIPENGIPREAKVRKEHKRGGSNSGIPEIGILEIGIPENNVGGTSENGVPEYGTPDENRALTTRKQSVPKIGIPETDAIKDIPKDSLKDTLSPRAIVSGFYKGIGQARISKEKRERAENNFKELLDDGFKQEDIQFAVEWTLNNAKEELYDFSIIKHTIGQAMAAKRKVEEEEAKRREREKAAARREAEEKRVAEEEEQIRAYKESLDAEERARLRERAEAEIRISGQYKKEFITEYLIGAKENELIRDQIGIGSPK